MGEARLNWRVTSFALACCATVPQNEKPYSCTLALEKNPRRGVQVHSAAGARRRDASRTLHSTNHNTNSFHLSRRREPSTCSRKLPLIQNLKMTQAMTTSTEMAVQLAKSESCVRNCLMSVLSAVCLHRQVRVRPKNESEKQVYSFVYTFFTFSLIQHVDIWRRKQEGREANRCRIRHFSLWV